VSGSRLVKVKLHTYWLFLPACRYIWLVPKYTNNAAAAATSFDFVNQSSRNAKYSDLANGAGGDWRYLIPVCDPRQKAKITECALLRASSMISVDDIRKLGWTNMSGDINRGRKGDWLYLIWKTQVAY
jgi:hypothetical protein